MDLQLINKIIKDGEQINIYKIKNEVFYKILYNEKIYTLSENKKGIRIIKKWESMEKFIA